MLYLIFNNSRQLLYLTQFFGLLCVIWAGGGGGIDPSYDFVLRTVSIYFTVLLKY